MNHQAKVQDHLILKEIHQNKGLAQKHQPSKMSVRLSQIYWRPV